MSNPTLHEFIRELDASGKRYRLTTREGSVIVYVELADERWEVEFFVDREPEVEIFRSDGTIFALETAVGAEEEGSD